MKLVEFTVYDVGSLVSVNPEAVSQVGMMKDGHAIIHRIIY